MTTREAIDMLEYFKKEDLLIQKFRKINNSAVEDCKELLDICLSALRKQLDEETDGWFYMDFYTGEIHKAQTLIDSDSTIINWNSESKGSK